MKEKVRADKELAQEMVNTEKSKQRSLESEADLADAQTKTENETRAGKVEKLTKEINALVADTDWTTERSRTEAYNRLLDILSAKLSKSASEAIAQEIMRKQRSGGWVFNHFKDKEIDYLIRKYSSKK